MVRANKPDVLAHVRAGLLADAQAAAGSNGLLSKTEQATLPNGLLEKAADRIRENGGAGTRVDVETLVAKASKRVATLLGQVNQRSGAGAAVVSKREILALSELNQEAGARVARAYELITGKAITFEDPSPPSGVRLSASEVTSALEPSLGTQSPRVRGEIEVFNESGDNGVNTFGDALPGAVDIADALARAKALWSSSWGFSAWGMEVQETTPQQAIDGFLGAARELYAAEGHEPAEVDGIVQAFADRVQQTFGQLEDVRLATGPSVDSESGGTYLFGKTSDGWVGLAVRQYRDG